MGLYLSGKEEADAGRRAAQQKERERERRMEEAGEAESSQREVQRANLPDEIKPARKRNWNRDENYGSHVPRRVLFFRPPRARARAAPYNAHERVYFRSDVNQTSRNAAEYRLVGRDRRIRGK